MDTKPIYVERTKFRDRGRKLFLLRGLDLATSEHKEIVLIIIKIPSSKSVHTG
jgi:hypothetical protein